METHFLPSDRAIEAAVLAIQHQYGLIQRVAEEFFDIREELSLRPTGRNLDNVTTKNYPDAYAKQADGRLAIVEATTGDWRKHIVKDDLPRLRTLGKGQVALYRMFATTNEEALIPQKAPVKKIAKPNQAAPTGKKKAPPLSEDQLRKLIADECGISIDQVQFIFLRQFVKEIRNPKYLRILQMLKVPVAPAPFSLAGTYTPIGPKDITPSLADFVAGRVAPAEPVTALLDAVRQKRTVRLEGPGATGKTSFALAAAHSWNQTGTSFYIDLDSYDLGSPHAQRELIDAGAFFGTSRTLFILDNCHKADQQHLEAVLSAWKNLAIEPRILATCRATQAVLAPSIRNAHRVPRTIGIDDLLTVYRRLARARSGSDEVTQPPAHAIDAWRGWTGDLIAFSLALFPTLHAKGSSNNWELSPQHAADYVNHAYVSPLPNKERAALIKVALLAGFEMPASFQGLGNFAPVSALAAGTILESTHGTQGLRKRFTLPHYQLGALILESCEPGEPTRALEEVAISDPFQAAYIARRMGELNEHAKAKKVLMAVRDKLLTFNPDFSAAYLGTITQLYLDHGLAAVSDIEAGLLDAIDRFLPPKANPVEGLASFLEFAKISMPLLFASALARLAEPSVMKRICESMASAIPSSVASLYRFASAEGLPLAPAMRRKLNSEDVLEPLALRLSTLLPRDIEKFLRFVDGFDDKSVQYFKRRLLACPGSRMDPGYVLSMPLAAIISLIQTAPTASALALRDISIEAWRGRDWALDHRLQAVLGAATTALTSIGRADLVPEVAQRAMQFWRTRTDTSSKAIGRQLAVLMHHLPIEESHVNLAHLSADLHASGRLGEIFTQTSLDHNSRMLFDAWTRFGQAARNLLPASYKKHLVRYMRSDVAANPHARRSLLQAAGIVEIFDLEAHPLSDNLSLAQLDGDYSGCPIAWIGSRHVASRINSASGPVQSAPAMPITAHTSAFLARLT